MEPSVERPRDDEERQRLWSFGEGSFQLPGETGEERGGVGARPFGGTGRVEAKLAKAGPWRIARPSTEDSA